MRHLIMITIFFISLYGAFATNLYHTGKSHSTDNSCLIVTLLDSFGDGWGKVLFYYESPGAEETGYSAPNCSAKVLTKKICGIKDGFYFLVVQSIDNDAVPENTWEIRWTVEIEKSGLLYTGGYNTSLVFDYDIESDDFRIVYWHNMWSNTLNLTLCGSSSAVLEGSCQPSPSRPDFGKPYPQILQKHVSKPTATPVSQKVIGGKRGPKLTRRADNSESTVSTNDSYVANSYAAYQGPDDSHSAPRLDVKDASKFSRVEIIESSGYMNETLLSAVEEVSNGSLAISEGNADTLYSSLLGRRHSRSERLSNSRRGKLLSGKESGEDITSGGHSGSESNSTSLDETVYGTVTTNSSVGAYSNHGYDTSVHERSERRVVQRIVNNLFGGLGGNSEGESHMANDTSGSAGDLEEYNSTAINPSGGSSSIGISREWRRVRPSQRGTNVFRSKIRDGVEDLVELVEQSSGNATQEFLSIVDIFDEIGNESTSHAGGHELNTEAKAQRSKFREIISERFPKLFHVSSETTLSNGQAHSSNDSDSQSSYASGNESYANNYSENDLIEASPFRGSLIKEIVKRYENRLKKRSKVIFESGNSAAPSFGYGNETAEVESTVTQEVYPTMMPSMSYSAENYSEAGGSSGSMLERFGGRYHHERVDIDRKVDSHIVRNIPSMGIEKYVVSGSNSSNADDYESEEVLTTNSTGAGGSGISEYLDVSGRLGSGIRLIGISSKKRQTGKTGRSRPTFIQSGEGGAENVTYSDSSEQFLLLSDSLYTNTTGEEHSDGVEAEFLLPGLRRTRAPRGRHDGVSEHGTNSSSDSVPTSAPTEYGIGYGNSTESIGGGSGDLFPRIDGGIRGGLFRGQQGRYRSPGGESIHGGAENDTWSNATSVPTFYPTHLPTPGRIGGDSGGLLKGSVAKRTRRHANHHSDSASIYGAGSNSTEYESLYTSSPTEMPSQNMTVVMYDEDSAVNSNTATYSYVGATKSPSTQTSKPPVKKLGRNKHKHSKVATGIPTATLKVEMFSKDGQGWYKPNYEGLAFYISDESKTELVAYGTLANGSYSGFCEFCFDDGSYYFRVSTPEPQNTPASWSFCNTVGEYGEQLAFHIKDGVCIPDALLNVQMICDATYSTVVTVKGSLTLTGVSSEVIDSGSIWVLTSALSESVTGWDNSAIFISRTVLSVHPFDFSHRALSSFTYDVEFEASFVSELAYEIDGTSFFGVQGLVEELKDELNNVISSGTFSETVRTLAISTGVVALDDVHGVALLDLSVEDIIYMGTKDIETVEAIVEMNSQAEAKQEFLLRDLLSSPEFISFVCMVGIGLVSFVGVVVVSVKLRRVSSATHDVIHDDSLHSESFMSNHVTSASRSPVRAGNM